MIPPMPPPIMEARMENKLNPHTFIVSLVHKVLQNIVRKKAIKNKSVNSIKI